MPPITTMRGGRRGSIGGYPHQWFDISSTYMPPSVKELFRWCQYLYSSHSEIAPIINKKCSYVITGYNYDTDKEKPKKLWKEVLEKTVRIRELEYKLLLDYAVYGNAYASIMYPFERYLECRACKHKQVAKKSEWEYAEFQFISKCSKCESKGVMDAEDKVIRNRSRVKVIRWNPQYIDIRYNPLTDASEYIYKIPKWMRQRIENKKLNKVLVDGTPMEFLKAIKDRKNIKLDDSNIYHFKNPSVSAEDDAYGMPPLLPVFKDAWLFQTYKRAQEAIALEHVLPLTLIIPQASSSGVSPHMNADLGEWSRKMMDIVGRWRRDQNSIYTVPFPVSVENIRGDAKSLNVFDELNMIRQQIAGGLDVPQEFIYGGLNWSGSSISLRVLENLFLNMIEQLNSFLQDFLVPKLQRFLSLPNVRISHKDFKMADDVQQKQIALNLRQTNTVSDRTTLEELGFDPEQERRRKADEAADRDAAIIKQMVVQAEAQGRALQTQTDYQLKSQQKQREMGLDNDQMQKKGSLEPIAGLSVQYTPGLLDSLVDQFLKGPGDVDHKRIELAKIQQHQPEVAQAIRERLSLIKSQANSPEMKPLPEQRAPRRKSSPV